ncbi:MAG: DUF6250 domain-containing protein [Ferruginibacter sp.]
MLLPNSTDRKQQNGRIKFPVNGVIYSNWKDEHPFTHGYFGFRSTRSRQEIDDLEIYQLD